MKPEKENPNTPKDLVKQQILRELLNSTPTKKQIALNVGISRPTLNKYLAEMNTVESPDKDYMDMTLALIKIQHQIDSLVEQMKMKYT